MAGNVQKRIVIMINFIKLIYNIFLAAIIFPLQVILLIITLPLFFILWIIALILGISTEFTIHRIIK